MLPMPQCVLPLDMNSQAHLHMEYPIAWQVPSPITQSPLPPMPLCVHPLDINSHSQLHTEFPLG